MSMKRGAACCAIVSAILFGGPFCSVLPAQADGYRAVSPPRALMNIDLQAGGGAHIGQKSFMGRWTFLSIGYTHCPDVCPMVLDNLAAVHDEMGKTLSGPALPQMMFVSVDPERDTPDELKAFVENFGDGFIGATGTRAAIDSLVKQLGAYYRIGRNDKDGYYSVNHSAEIFLIGPQCRLRARFLPPLNPKHALSDFLRISGVHPIAAAKAARRKSGQ